MAAQLCTTGGAWFTAVALPLALALPLAKRKPVEIIKPFDDNDGNNTSSSPFLTHHRTSNEMTPERCPLCRGDGMLPCQVCHGEGTLRRGGFSRRNAVRMTTLVGSKWTSAQAIDGKWRHFLCIQKKGSNMRNAVAVLNSTCGPTQNRISIDVPVKDLKSREQWQSGWTTLSDIRSTTGPQATRCSACKGEASVLCPRCEGLGQINLL